MVSVIMSTYNENSEMICASVESILNQTYSDIEFIIVIDNPKNVKLCDLLEKYASNDNRITLIYNKKNMGLVASLNLALKYTHGAYIARMDADDIALPNRINIQLDYLNKNNLDIVGGLTKYIDENEQGTGRQSPYYREEDIPKVILHESCIPHPTWLVKSEVYSKLKGYRYIDSCEDYDFLLRAIKTGYRIGLCDCVVLYYRINLSGISKTKAFKQFLSFHFLSNNHNKIDKISEENLNVYLNRNNTRRNEKNFLSARAAMNRVLDHNLRRIERCGALIIAVFVSRYHFMKLIDLVIAKRYRRFI